MKLDLHIHSAHSRDATGSPKEIVKRCRSIGLDGFAITDHNAIQGSLEAYSLAGSEGILVVRGIEISTAEGHVLALGVSEPVERGLPLEETIERVHGLGGACVAAHPKRFPSGMGLDLAGTGRFDAIETLNGGSSNRSNRLADEVARKKSRPVTGGSDAHGLDQVGKAYTVLESASREEDVLDAIRKGQTSVGGRSRSRTEGVRYSWETLMEWLRGDFRRL